MSNLRRRCVNILVFIIGPLMLGGIARFYVHLTGWFPGSALAEIVGLVCLILTARAYTWLDDKYGF